MNVGIYLCLDQYFLPKVLRLRKEAAVSTKHKKGKPIRNNNKNTIVLQCDKEATSNSEKNFWPLIIIICHESSICTVQHYVSNV
jgi:hypothetical protein